MVMATRAKMEQEEYRAIQTVVLAKNNLRRVKAAEVTVGPLVNPLRVVFATAPRTQRSTHRGSTKAWSGGHLGGVNNLHLAL